MALLFCDSFDHYDTAHAGEKWNTVSNIAIGAAYGREGQGLAASSASANKFLPASASLFLGAAVKPTGAGAQASFFSFYDSGTSQVNVGVDSTGRLYVFSNAYLGYSAPGVIKYNAWQYVEIGVTFGTGTTGSATGRVNGAAVLNLTGVNTAPSGNPSANTATIYVAAQPTVYVDDFYVCDGTGTINNTFLGDIKVVAALPNGNGRVSQFTRTGGTSAGNYTAVN